METAFLLIVFVLLPIVAFIALWIRRANRIANAFDPEVQKHAGPDGPRSRGGHAQIAGEECIACERTIVFEDDGVICPKCGELVHVGCRREGAHRCPATAAA